MWLTRGPQLARLSDHCAHRCAHCARWLPGAVGSGDNMYCIYRGFLEWGYLNIISTCLLAMVKPIWETSIHLSIHPEYVSSGTYTYMYHTYMYCAHIYIYIYYIYIPYMYIQYIYIYIYNIYTINIYIHTIYIYIIYNIYI